MFHFDNLAQKLLRKDFWQGLIAGQSTVGDGSKRFTAEELRNLYDILHRNPVVNEGNKALVVETVRSVAEFLIWGDQHEPRIFELQHHLLTPFACLAGAWSPHTRSQGTTGIADGGSAGGRGRDVVQKVHSAQM
jgi:hypothetical protein